VLRVGFGYFFLVRGAVFFVEEFLPFLFQAATAVALLNGLCRRMFKIVTCANCIV
jgi:hypothetical protein